MTTKLENGTQIWTTEAIEAARTSRPFMLHDIDPSLLDSHEALRAELAEVREKNDALEKGAEIRDDQLQRAKDLLAAAREELAALLKERDEARAMVTRLEGYCLGHKEHVEKLEALVGEEQAMALRTVPDDEDELRAVLEERCSPEEAERRIASAKARRARMMTPVAQRTATEPTADELRAELHARGLAVQNDATAIVRADSTVLPIYASAPTEREALAVLLETWRKR